MAKRGRGMREARNRKGARPKQGSRDIAQPARPGANAGGSALFLRYDPLFSSAPPLDCFPFDSKKAPCLGLARSEVGSPQRCGIAITASSVSFRLLRGIAEHRDGMTLGRKG